MHLRLFSRSMAPLPRWSCQGTEQACCRRGYWPAWAAARGPPGSVDLQLLSGPSYAGAGEEPCGSQHGETPGFNSLVGAVMGFSILLSAEVFKHDSAVWYLDGSIGVLIGLTIFAYGVKLLIDMVPRVRQTRHYEMFE